MSFLGFDLFKTTHSNYGICDETTKTPEPQPLIDVPMLHLSRPKSAWSYRSADLKPLQNITDYVPVYGDKTKSRTAISDEEWQILGKKRIDLLSKYGYSSHRESKTQCDDFGATDKWHAEPKHITFDNCYILGESKLNTDMASQFDTPTKFNRHSFCEYKPFSTRRYEGQRLKYCTPMDYRPIQMNPLESTISVDKLNSPMGPDHFAMLPLIGESESAAFRNNLMKPLAQCASSNELDDMSMDPFCEEQIVQEKEPIGK